MMLFDWLDRAEQAREVAGQLTNPAARQAVIRLAESYERLGASCCHPSGAPQTELAKRGQASK